MLTALAVGKWIIAWASAHDLTLAWLFSAILSQMPAKDPETMGFAKQWLYKIAQLLAANLNHLQTQKKL